MLELLFDLLTGAVGDRAARTRGWLVGLTLLVLIVAAALILRALLD